MEALMMRASLSYPTDTRVYLLTINLEEESAVYRLHLHLKGMVSLFKPINGRYCIM